MHNSSLIANEFLKIAEKEKNSLTPMQILKLVYIAHGWMLGLYSRPLIKEHVEAWKYGPVVSDLYHKIKDYRSSPVKKIKGSFGDSKIDEYEKDIIEQVYKKYGYMSGMDLSMLTHSKDTPWHKTWHRGISTISNDLIEYYYGQLAKAK